MATVVEGILKLISSNPKEDSNIIMASDSRKRSALMNGVRRDGSVLRQQYLDLNDLLIYRLVHNFFRASDNVFWSHAAEGSFIAKNVGIQALFDVLRHSAPKFLVAKDVSVDFLTKYLGPASSLDFTKPEFRNPSGSGRTRIKQAIKELIDIPV